MTIKPKHKWAASYKYHPHGEIYSVGTGGLWNQRRGKGRIASLKFFIACLIFHHSAFPTLPNRDFKTAWACLYLISEVWADDSQSMFPDRILPPGNVDTDSRDLMCRSFWTFCSQGTCSQGFGAVLLPMGLCFKDILRQRQSPRLLGSCCFCATSISHWGDWSTDRPRRLLCTFRKINGKSKLSSWKWYR